MDDIHAQLVTAVNNYHTPIEAAELLKQNPPLIIASVSGGGKDTVAQYTQDNSQYRRVVTTTTRPMRPGETNGIDYWFVDETTMLDLVHKGAFIEVKELHGQQISGSSIAAYKTTLDAGNKPLLSVDVQGITEIMKHIPNLQPVFILPPNFETWLNRLGNRGVMSHIEKLRRFRSAQAELELVLHNPHFKLVVNTEIPAVAKEILGGASDHTEQHRNRELVQQLLDHIHTHS